MQWQPSELNTLEGQIVLWFLIIFYYFDCTKCKFPDFSLTFPNINFFPWPSTKFPDFSLTFAKSGISLTFPWPLDTLLYFCTKSPPYIWRAFCAKIKVLQFITHVTTPQTDHLTVSSHKTEPSFLTMSWHQSIYPGYQYIWHKTEPSFLTMSWHQSIYPGYQSSIISLTEGSMNTKASCQPGHNTLYIYMIHRTQDWAILPDHVMTPIHLPRLSVINYLPHRGIHEHRGFLSAWPQHIVYIWYIYDTYDTRLSHPSWPCHDTNPFTPAISHQLSPSQRDPWTQRLLVSLATTHCINMIHMTQDWAILPDHVMTPIHLPQLSVHMTQDWAILPDHVMTPIHLPLLSVINYLPHRGIHEHRDSLSAIATTHCTYIWYIDDTYDTWNLEFIIFNMYVLRCCKVMMNDYNRFLNKDDGNITSYNFKILNENNQIW